MYPIYKLGKRLLTGGAKAQAEKEINKRLLKLKKAHGAEAADEAREIVEVSQGLRKKLSRRRLLRNAALGTVAVGTGIFAADTAFDASKDAADKRVEAVVEEFGAWKDKFLKTAFALYDDFGKLVQLLMKLDTWQTIGHHTLHGLADDVIDFVRSGDTSPDKMGQSLDEILKKNADIKRVYDDIQKHVAELRALVDDFGTIVSDTTDNEVQKERFLDDFEESFKRQLKQRTIGD